MKYRFDQKTGSFFNYEVETGKNWDNHMWTKTPHGYFISTVNHMGGSASHLLRDTSERVYLTKKACVYLRDEDTKKYWNIGEGPTAQGVSNYTCEHGLLFSAVSSRKCGIYAKQTITVVPDTLAEGWCVTVKNTTKKEKHLSVFPFLEFDLSGFTQNYYYYPANTGFPRYFPEVNGVFCYQDSPFMPEDIFSGYLISSEKPHAYTTRVEHFLGTSGSMANPKCLRDGADLPNTLSAVRVRGAILQNKVTLAPGEEKTLYYTLGFASSSADAFLSSAPSLMEKTKASFHALYERGVATFGTLRTKCDEKRIENIMNFWAQKQVSYCMLGKCAVRDNSQIAWGILNYDTALAKEALVNCLSHQWYDGHSMQTWTVGYVEKDIYSDPGTWMVLATCEYLKESGDLAFLDECIPFVDHEGATLYEHLLRACDWFMKAENYGKNGIPRIFHADWNDALNIPDDTAESVFMAMLICCVLREVSDVCRLRGDKERAEELLAFREKLADTTNKVAWNGDYYVRAFSKFGTVGDKTSKIGGNIYINPQAWAVLADIVPQDRLEKLLSSIDSMDTPDGVPICAPAYQKYDPALGRMSAMPAGVYENGGIYNHACAFKVMADCRLGRGDKAVGTLLKMIPGGENNPSEITTTEPYVFTNCYLKHPHENMVVGFSWQTGSSAWGLRTYYEGVLGIIRTYEGLRISPNLPESFRRTEVTRLYRGATLQITIINEGGKNVSLWIDGKKQKGDLIPPFADNKTHKILVKMQ